MYMTKIHLTLTHKSFGQGSNSHSLSHDSVVGYSSPPIIKHEISYQYLCSFRPITRQFAKADRLIADIQHVPYASKKSKATPTRVVVSLVEEAILATLKGRAEAIEDGEEPLVFRQGEQGTLVILRLDSGTGDGREGREGGRGGDKPTDSEPEPSDFEREEEDDPNLEWMT